MEIDWTKEKLNVKIACHHIIEGYKIYKEMSDEDKQRFNFLLDHLIPQETDAKTETSS